MLIYILQKYKKNGKQTYILNKNKRGAPFLRKEHHSINIISYIFIYLRTRLGWG